ncbi:hypothetical protein [Xanthomonas hortorum]|uniref:DUF3077 domain-containing protein n=1 Tax=Xanthomonas hortorum pv. pelargonii TaxID=453602 RepID=A0A6V7F7X9_9XANT|nr:hypothetical protein [Xanthomonas hortorum]MCE4354983.1 hypothetical protein [Xanthomonas hortorum pv. pelargonii]MCM5524702.1 hypothetical protein [Xanthomonas hortorum pv. pelargonii]MCM5537166.1 hypothetical protein [Xanthomonas hortorum pv. pelargonii]MCM5541349.1 hypothetical protein [Xanthomonas hortorum pv. pelargonii]MCM5544688.1 hypothetical protein [Xanthomonas hortorum pv. pelargonii]
MTTTKTRKTTAPEGRAQTQEEQFTFGVTIEQIDRFHALLRTITAQSDMVAVCSGKPLDATSLSVLGESIFNAARAVRGIVDEIDAQRLHAGGADPTG